MAPFLPANPDLQRFRREARRLQRAVRSGEARALDIVARHHPDGAPAEAATFTLSAAQLVVARANGLPSWPRLRAHVATVGLLGRDPTRDPRTKDAAAQLCALACLVYSDRDHPDRRAAAEQLLATDPELPGRDPYAAAVTGDAEAVTRHLRDDPGVATREGGPFRWPPLLYVTFSRIQQRDALAAAGALLDAGADVDAGYLWQGLTPPFTALTGVFGEGEQGPGRQPRHREADRLARLLLDRGAEANDGQTLYNRMFLPDDSHLELLFEYGLGRGDGGVWVRRLGSLTESVGQMMERQLRNAVEQGFTARLDLLARHGWGPDTLLEDGRTVRDLAADLDATAPPIHRAQSPDQVLAAVAGGADVDARHEGRTALHQAAFAGDIARVRALLDAGADPSPRDDEHGATPLQWAEYACQPEAADALRAASG